MNQLVAPLARAHDPVHVDAWKTASGDRKRLEPSRQLLPEDRRASARRTQVVKQGADGGRLARPVGAEKAEGLALHHLEVDVDDAAMGAVGLRELLGLDDRAQATDDYRTRASAQAGANQPAPRWHKTDFARGVPARRVRRSSRAA
jgi:hypothetical protein